MSDTLGDDRPPSRRGTAGLVVLVLVLAGLAGVRLLHGPGDRTPSASAERSPSPTASVPPTTQPASTQPPIAHYTAVNVPLPPAPWSRLPTVGGAFVDYAVGDRVRWLGHTFRLHPGDLVVAMERAGRGPVVAVQSEGSTVLEQLRIGGDPLVLETFRDESRHLQGLAVDPTGRHVAYAVTSGVPQGPFGLVVRDLATGSVLAERPTGRSYAVRDWVRSGVLLEAVTDRGGPPYRWTPGPADPVQITPPARTRRGGPFLLAASPTRRQWAVRTGSCTALVRLGRRPDPHRCLPTISGPAAWSPAGDRLAGRGGRRALLVLDTRSGRSTEVTSLRRLFLAQVVWQDDGSLVAAVHTLADRRGAVLVCSVDGGCSRTRLGAASGSPDLVLAQ